MPALSTTHPTMMDVAKSLNPDGQAAAIVEMLNQTNEILDDMPAYPCNNKTTHIHTIRTGIPRPTWRKLYAGVQPTKSERAQVTDTTGTMEAFSEIDYKLWQLAPNGDAFRLSEDRAHIEGIAQEHATTVMYGNEGTEPASFTGLAPRYSDPSAESGENMLDAGGAGSTNTSVWLIVWGPETVFGLYPDGTQAGITFEDMGSTVIENIDGAGGRMKALRSHYGLDCGIAVKDWRYAVRICNIDVNALTKDASAGADLIDLMTQAVEIPPDLNGRVAWYCNRTIRSFLRRQKVHANNVRIGMDEVAGKRVTTFDEIPVRRVDALTSNEAAITFQ